MFIVDCQQSTPEWHEARLGKATASKFQDILSEPRAKKDKDEGKLSETANTYMMTLLAEILTGQQVELFGRPLEWGTEQEEPARIYYEFIYDVEVKALGFVMPNEQSLIGVSPDGLVGDKGMIEIKCPFNSVNHLKTVLSGEMPKSHMAQVQGNLWVLEREWCDFISYDPRMTSDNMKFFMKRIYRDDVYIKNLSQKLDSFCATLIKRVAECQSFSNAKVA